MITAYWTGFIATFTVVLVTFLRDRDASKASLLDWSFVIVTAAIWPATLPFIVSHKIKVMTAAHRRAAKHIQALQADADASGFPV